MLKCGNSSDDMTRAGWAVGESSGFRCYWKKAVVRVLRGRRQLSHLFYEARDLLKSS
jgi:hypothetical protein